LIDRKTWRENGAIGLRLIGDHFEQTSARPPGYERPWALPPRAAGDRSAAPVRPAARDATPRTEDMEEGD
jgi:hypothetical protein